MDVFLQLHLETRMNSIKKLETITEKLCGSDSWRGARY